MELDNDWCVCLSLLSPILFVLNDIFWLGSFLLLFFVRSPVYRMHQERARVREPSFQVYLFISLRKKSVLLYLFSSFIVLCSIRFIHFYRIIRLQQISNETVSFDAFGGAKTKLVEIFIDRCCCWCSFQLLFVSSSAFNRFYFILFSNCS